MNDTVMMVKENSAERTIDLILTVEEAIIKEGMLRNVPGPIKSGVDAGKAVYDGIRPHADMSTVPIFSDRNPAP